MSLGNDPSVSIGEPCPCRGGVIEEPHTAVVTCFDGADREKTVCGMCGESDGY